MSKSVTVSAGTSVNGIPASVELIDLGQSGKRLVKTVAMVGHSPSTRDDAPYQDGSIEIWTMNDAFTWIPRITRWFELHEEKVWRSPARRTAGYVDALMRHGGPVYMERAYPDIPNAVVYPFERVTKRWPGRFGSSFAYMFAVAIEEGFTRIEVYGCDLASEEEYRKQRESMAWWIGYAEGKGIEVYLPPACPLLKAHDYGRNQGHGPVTREEVQQMFAHLGKQQGDLAARLNHVAGAREMLIRFSNYFEQAGYAPPGSPPVIIVPGG